MNEISVPGKAFIAGEYIAVKGGPCLVMATSPKFTMTVSKATNATNEKLGAEFFAHLASPAGKYASKNPEVFENRFEFFDAYDGRGGFGASTAQFIMLYAWHLNQKGQQVNADQLMFEYRDCAYSGVGLEPSGADLITQWKGGFCFVEKNKARIESSDFPFAELDIILFSTGVKVATHEHLAKLTSFDSCSLENDFEKLEQAWKSKDAVGFCNSINAYRKSLQALDFEADSTKKIIESLNKQIDIRAAKGCGALGSDVILLVVDRSKSSQIQRLLQEEDYKFIMTQNQVSAGLVI